MAALQARNTVLYEIQEACKQLSLPVPSAAFASTVTDGTALMMGSMANLAGVLVTDAFNWEFMQETLTCVGDGVTVLFPLPDNFGSIVEQTGWNNALRRPVTVLNDQQWAMVNGFLSGSFAMSPACRLYNDNVQFITAPAAGSSTTFQYRKKFWVIDQDNGSLKDKCEKDGDIPLFDWMLMILAVKVKYLGAKRMDTTDAQSDFNDRITQLTQKNKMAPILPLSGPMPGNFRYIDISNISDTGFGS